MLLYTYIYFTLSNLCVIHFYTVCYIISNKIIKFIVYIVDNTLFYICKCYIPVCAKVFFNKYLCLIII